MIELFCKLVRTLKKEGALFRDIPSLLNISTLDIFGWEGRKITLQEKISQSLESSHEMGEGDWEDRLDALKPYKETFEELYPDKGLDKSTVVDALTEYQKQLVTPAPLDDFIKGKKGTLSEKQLRGLKVFDSLNCASCHTGPLLGGQMHQKMGIVKPWPNQEDLGYFNLTGDESHRLVFRVSPLRNVTATAPYFHDASSRTILDAIRKMGEYEAGVVISNEQSLEIFEFLKSVKGEVPEKWVNAPILPE